MSKADLLRARPKAQLRPTRAGAFSLSQPSFERAEERPEGSEPVQRVEYRLRWGRLAEVRIRTRFTKAWSRLIAGATAKWGKPHKIRRHSWRWRLRDGLVMLRAPVRDSFVTLRLRRRLDRHSPIAESWSKPWGGDLRIFRVGAWRIDIERASFRKLFSHSATVQHLLRVAPHHRAGRPGGIKLYGIRPRSLFARLGLRNGDVITHLAGKPTQDPQGILETLHRLRRMSSFDARLERRGRPLRLKYRVVP